MHRTGCPRAKRRTTGRKRLTKGLLNLLLLLTRTTSGTRQGCEPGWYATGHRAASWRLLPRRARPIPTGGRRPRRMRKLSRYWPRCWVGRHFPSRPTWSDRESRSAAGSAIDAIHRAQSRPAAPRSSSWCSVWNVNSKRCGAHHLCTVVRGAKQHRRARPREVTIPPRTFPTEAAARGGGSATTSIASCAWSDSPTSRQRSRGSHNSSRANRRGWMAPARWCNITRARAS